MGASESLPPPAHPQTPVSETLPNTTFVLDLRPAQECLIAADVHWNAAEEQLGQLGLNAEKIWRKALAKPEQLKIGRRILSLTELATHMAQSAYGLGRTCDAREITQALPVKKRQEEVARHAQVSGEQYVKIVAGSVRQGIDTDIVTSTLQHHLSALGNQQIAFDETARILTSDTTIGRALLNTVEDWAAIPPEHAGEEKLIIQMLATYGQGLRGGQKSILQEAIELYSPPAKAYAEDFLDTYLIDEEGEKTPQPPERLQLAFDILRLNQKLFAQVVSDPDPEQAYRMMWASEYESWPQPLLTGLREHHKTILHQRWAYLKERLLPHARPSRQLYRTTPPVRPT